MSSRGLGLLDLLLARTVVRGVLDLGLGLGLFLRRGGLCLADLLGVHHGFGAVLGGVGALGGFLTVFGTQ
jgi:hypothetical protein